MYTNKLNENKQREMSGILDLAKFPNQIDSDTVPYGTWITCVWKIY